MINAEQILILRYLKAADTAIPFPLPPIEGVNENTLMVNLHELSDMHLIGLSAGTVHIDTDGQDYLTRIDYNMPIKEKTPSVSLHNVGNVYSNIHGSVLNTETSLDKAQISNINETNPPTKSKGVPSYLKTIGIVATTILALLALWEFWLKHIVVK